MQWPRLGNPDIVAREYFTPDEAESIAASIRLRCDMGFPLDAEGVGAFCSEMLQKLGRGEDSFSGKRVKCSDCFVNKFLKDFDLARYKASAIDSARARQATKVVRDDFFDLCNTVVAQEHAKGKLSWATPGLVSPHALLH